MISKWDAIGSFYNRNEEIENAGYEPDEIYSENGEKYSWKKFFSDGRGCVVTGRVCEFNSWKRFAYFYTSISSEVDRMALLSFSTRNDLIVWLDGKKVGSVERAEYCWFDFMHNPDHSGHSISVPLKSGENHILVLVQGGRYGGDGFYASLKRIDEGM